VDFVGFFIKEKRRRRGFGRERREKWDVGVSIKTS